MNAVVHTLSSGSDGNATLVSDGKTTILVDAGISARRISAALRAHLLTASDVVAVLVTHEHGDHIAGLSVFGRPVYAAAKTCQALAGKFSRKAIEPGQSFAVGDIVVTPFATPHDTPQSLGYLLCVAGTSVAVCTDLGHMPPEALELLCTAKVVLLEANHDVQMLRRGPYPAFLKDRILGRNGHLSNDACAETLCRCVQSGTRSMMLCHLSLENNSPDLALGTVAHSLHTQGAVVGRDVTLQVAPHGMPGEPIWLDEL